MNNWRRSGQLETDSWFWRDTTAPSCLAVSILPVPLQTPRDGHSASKAVWATFIQVSILVGWDFPLTLPQFPPWSLAWSGKYPGKVSSTAKTLPNADTTHPSLSTQLVFRKATSQEMKSWRWARPQSPAAFHPWIANLGEISSPGCSLSCQPSSRGSVTDSPPHWCCYCFGKMEASLAKNPLFSGHHLLMDD